MTMSVHGGKWYQRDGYDRCDYCGSLTPAEALRRMTTPGCKFSGTDKGGYKFYFTGETGDYGKFYGAHLEDLGPDELAAWAAVSRRVLGVDWAYKPGAAPDCFLPRIDNFYGWQVFGTVGPDGAPVFADGSPTPPSDEWWAKARAAEAKP
jgi:hypothetical protein